jgi:hypothetical protein
MEVKKVPCIGCDRDCPEPYVITTDAGGNNLCVACVLIDVIEFAQIKGYKTGQGVGCFNEYDQNLAYDLHDIPENFNGGWAEYYP